MDRGRLHVILRNRPDIVPQWSDEEVARRRLRLSRRSLEVRPEPKPKPKRVRKLANDEEKITELRFRLSNISWFMLMLNEPIARTANAEDNVPGHFFGERFGSVRLENKEDPLLCRLYVDLNPVRAGVAKTPEDSQYKGACDRIEDREEEEELQAAAFGVTHIECPFRPKTLAAKKSFSIPRQMVCQPGSPSCFRPRNPPKLATARNKFGPSGFPVGRREP